MRNDTDKPKQKQDIPTMAGKVKPEIYDLVFNTLKKRGLTVNEFIVNVCEVILRYMSPDHNRTPEIERCMNLFEHMVGWKEAVLMSDPSARLEVYKAVYFLYAPGKKGLLPVMVEEPPMFGQWKQTENINTIFEAVVAHLVPERYRRLRALAVDMGATSLLDMLDILIDEQTKELEFEQMRSEFADNDRSDFGRKPADAPYRRKRNRNIEQMGTIRFESNDTPEDNSDY